MLSKRIVSMMNSVGASASALGIGNPARTPMAYPDQLALRTIDE